MKIRCPTCNKTESHDGLRCEFCGDCCSTLYQGWFKAVETNWINEGTVTDGLMHNHISCKACATERGKNNEDFN